MGFFSREPDPKDAPKPPEPPKPPVPPKAPQAALEREETSGLPPLKLQEIFRSSEPVIKVDKGARLDKTTITAIDVWGEYTIVLLQGEDRIRVIDGRGLEVKNFVPIGDKKMEWKFNSNPWEDIREFSYYGSGFGGRQSIHYEKLTEPLRGICASHFKTSLENISLISLTSGDFPPFSWQISFPLEGKYVLLHDYKNGAFIAFQTHNQAGTALPPQNWARFDSFSHPLISRLPNDLLPVLRNLWNLKSQKVVLIDRQQEVRIFDDHLSIVPDPIGRGTSVFTDRVADIKDNCCKDSKENTIYYCTSTHPKTITRLNLDGSADTWKPETVMLPASYELVDRLRMDGSGNFFFLETDSGVVVISKDTMKEVGKIPSDVHFSLDQQGRIRTINPQGCLVAYDINLHEIHTAICQKRAKNLAAGVDIRDLFAGPGAPKKAGAAAAKPDDYDYLKPTVDEYTTQLKPVVDALSTLEDLQERKNSLETLRQKLQTQGLSPAACQHILDQLETLFADRETVLAGTKIKQFTDHVRAQTASGLSLTTAAEARESLTALDHLLPFADAATRTAVLDLKTATERSIADLFTREGKAIERQVDELIAGVEKTLSAMTGKPQFDAWYESDFPQLLSRLGMIARDCPLEAATTHQKITYARERLNTIAGQYKKQFETQYAKTRELAMERFSLQAAMVSEDIKGLIERLQTQHFKTRTEAEAYLRKSEMKKNIEEAIRAITAKKPDFGKDLEKTLKVQIANALGAIERGAGVVIQETGEQMVLVGDEWFPLFEERVAVEEKRTVEMTFLEEARSKGPGVKADDVMGDVGFRVMEETGKVRTRRAYEGLGDEEEWRGGGYHWRGQPLPTQYVSRAEFQKRRRNYREWINPGSELKQELQAKIDAVKTSYRTRPLRKMVSEMTDAEKSQHEAWKEAYNKAFADYVSFCLQHDIPLLKRHEQVLSEQPHEGTNGKGFVPDWKNHWVMDQETRDHLTKMAQAFKMQSELQEGSLLLSGHAGTGKDVLFKMFCHITQRPYYAFDCSKWTTEHELSEDVTLVSEDGVSVIKGVPSIVLQAIQTPGAVLYFNEVNAMPHQAQIFLHSLMDEKRSLTLKTRSGRTIKANPTVLIGASQNKGYPGTFDLQCAFKSRTMPIDIPYPSLEREKTPDDKITHPPFNASEALRMARSVASLEDFTLDQNMKNNVFVQIWNNVVNGIQNNAPRLTPVQRFDLEVILALTQFAHELRAHFMAKFEKTKASRSRDALPVTQPLTPREMRRFANKLSDIHDNEKLKPDANPDKTAKALIYQFFLPHIDLMEDQTSIRDAMEGRKPGMPAWTSKKRLAV